MVRNAEDPAPLRLGLELRADVAGMAGSVQDESGTRRAFCGWLGLLSLLEAARAETLTITPERSTACPTTESD